MIIVRYGERDQMSYVHHSNHALYLEPLIVEDLSN